MERPDFTFADGKEPAAPPTINAWLDIAGECLAMRVKHEADTSDQHLLEISPGPDGRTVIVMRQLFADHLCDAFGIGKGDRIDIAVKDDKTGDVTTIDPASRSRIIRISDEQVAMLALRRLADAERIYRATHDLKGASHLDTGKAWDRMRHAGDAARALLADEPMMEGEAGFGEFGEPMTLDGLRKSIAAFIEPEESSAEEFADEADGGGRAIYAHLQSWASNVRSGYADEAIRELFRPHSADKADSMVAGKRVDSIILDDPWLSPGEADVLRGDIARLEAALRAIIGADASDTDAMEQVILEAMVLMKGRDEGVDPISTVFSITTCDSHFDPDADVMVNGYAFVPKRRVLEMGWPAAYTKPDVNDIMATLRPGAAIIEERLRQISDEGYDPADDDGYTAPVLAEAAAAYCLAASDRSDHQPGIIWPWTAETFKPGDPMRNLEKAGALILAEMERLTRAMDRADQREADAAQEDEPVDTERAAWDWLEGMVDATSDEDPNDIAYSADQMVDAYMAGSSRISAADAAAAEIAEQEGGG